MRSTPPFSLLTFPCDTVEKILTRVVKNAAIVLKSNNPVKKMFCRTCLMVSRNKSLRYQ